MKYFYWAAVGTAFLINIGYTITSLTHQYHNRPSISSCIIQLSNHKCSIPFDTSVYNDEVLTLAAKFAIIPVAVITELLIAVCAVKNNDNMMQEKVGCRCSSLKQYLLLSVNVSTRIVEYSDHLTTFSTTAIPLCVLLLIYSQVTIAYVITLLLLPLGFTLAVACLLYQCQNPGRRTLQNNARCCGNMCSQSVMITATIGLILTLLVLYELMLLV